MVRIITEVDHTRRDLIKERLVEFNSGRSRVLRAMRGLPADDELPLHVYAYDDDRDGERERERDGGQDGVLTGVLTGGLTGFTWGHWLHVDLLWVADDRRGTGLGTELLLRAETEARMRGCAHARVESWGFQAPAFYEKCGYRLLAAIEDYPPGETDHLLVKSLD